MSRSSLAMMLIPCIFVNYAAIYDEYISASTLNLYFAQRVSSPYYDRSIVIKILLPLLDSKFIIKILIVLLSRFFIDESMSSKSISLYSTKLANT